MTSVTIFRNRRQEFTGFICSGHAGYADKGEDIVCAGISALVINTINSLETYTEETFTVGTDKKTGQITLRFERPIGHDAVLLMKSLILGLQGIQDTYGNDYIKIVFKEV